MEQEEMGMRVSLWASTFSLCSGLAGDRLSHPASGSTSVRWVYRHLPGRVLSKRRGRSYSSLRGRLLQHSDGSTVAALAGEFCFVL